MWRRAGPVVLAALLLSIPPAAFADTDRQTRTFPFPAERTLSLDITVGDVRIEGWSRDQAVVEIVRHAPSAARFAAIPIEIHDEDAVRIRVTQADGGTDPALRSDITLRVPHGARLSRVQIVEGRLQVTDLRGAINADVRRGPIEATGVQGMVRLETGIGDLTVRAARLSPDGLLRLRAFNGDVTLQLAERPADARVMALALNGTIESELPLRMADTWGPRWGEATLGKGEPVISLDVITGRIRIRVSG